MTYTKPVSPTASLPPLARLSTYSTEKISSALFNLRNLYLSKYPYPYPPSPVALRNQKKLPKLPIHDTSIPDSGYASAEEDEDVGCDIVDDDGCDEDQYDENDILRADSLERDFAIRWLTGFAARSDMWVYSEEIGEEEGEEDERAALVDEAASLLASFAGENDDEDCALTRKFVFPRGDDEASNSVEVELNDAPLLTEDHTSVGLQSWASSILLAHKLCADPLSFGLPTNDSNSKPLRILELGAGTGLLSIVTAKLLRPQLQQPVIVATDYHPSVLENLQANVATNFPGTKSPSPSRNPHRRSPLRFEKKAPIDVLPLDWQYPKYDPPLHEPFDIILAADVIYHPDHAMWIKKCVEDTLSKPNGIFWLMIPIRSTGRHEGMGSTVEAVFPFQGGMKQASEGTGVDEGDLRVAILRKEEFGRQDGVGRADESAYVMFKIGWVC